MKAGHVHGTDFYEPQLGDIGLTQIQGRVGAGIRFAQFLAGGGFWHYEHAFMVVNPNYTPEPLIIEAEPGGAQINPISRYVGYNVAYLRCPEELRKSVAAEAFKYKDIGYSFLDYGSLFCRHIGIPAPHLRKYIRSTGHMICSQLVDKIALDGGWHLFEDGRWEGDVMPADITRLYIKQQMELSRRKP